MKMLDENDLLRAGRLPDDPFADAVVMAPVDEAAAAKASGALQASTRSEVTVASKQKTSTSIGVTPRPAERQRREKWAGPYAGADDLTFPIGHVVFETCFVGAIGQPRFLTLLALCKHVRRDKHGTFWEHGAKRGLVISYASQGTLASQSGIARGTANEAINFLERLGLLKKKPIPDRAVPFVYVLGRIEREVEILFVERHLRELKSFLVAEGGGEMPAAAKTRAALTKRWLASRLPSKEERSDNVRASLIWDSTVTDDDPHVVDDDKGVTGTNTGCRRAEQRETVAVIGADTEEDKVEEEINGRTQEREAGLSRPREASPRKGFGGCASDDGNAVNGVVADLEAVWWEEMRAAFPEQTFGRWSAKDRGRVSYLVNSYGDPETIECALRHVVKNFSALVQRVRGKGGIPTVGFLVANHSQVVPEAQQCLAANAVEQEWRRWFEKNPSSLPPRDLGDRWRAAKKVLDSAGLTDDGGKRR